MKKLPNTAGHFLHTVEFRHESARHNFAILHFFHIQRNAAHRRVGHNENLKNFGHDNSRSVYELVYIDDYLMQGHVEKAKVAGCWALLVDETTDITTLQQFIFLV